jgi:hypothetical protein
MKENESQPKLTGTIPEAANLLGIGINQAYEAARRGDIPVLRIGKRHIVLMEQLRRRLEGAA